MYTRDIVIVGLAYGTVFMYRKSLLTYGSKEYR
jgi:hypothetical protein